MLQKVNVVFLVTKMEIPFGLMQHTFACNHRSEGFLLLL